MEVANNTARIVAVKNTLLWMENRNWVNPFIPANNPGLFDQTATYMFNESDLIQHYCGLEPTSVLVTSKDLEELVGSGYSSMNVEECIKALPATIGLAA